MQLTFLMKSMGKTKAASYWKLFHLSEIFFQPLNV